MGSVCKSILIIEDDPGIRRMLKLTIEFEGYSVLTASHGKEGLEILASLQSPCLVLLDLMMPVMDGFAFIEAVKNIDSLAIHPIIIVTAVADRAVFLESAYRIIKKPVDPDLLLSAVQEHCGESPV